MGIVILLLSSLWFIWNNYVCKWPASFTSTARYISKRPIIPGLLYCLFIYSTYFLTNILNTYICICRPNVAYLHVWNYAMGDKEARSCAAERKLRWYVPCPASWMLSNKSRAQAVKDQSFSILTLTLVIRSIPGCCSMFSRQYWLPTMKFLGQMITILLR